MHGCWGLFQKIAEKIRKTFVGMTEVALGTVLMKLAILHFSHCQYGFGAADITVNEGFVQVSIDPN